MTLTFYRHWPEVTSQEGRASRWWGGDMLIWVGLVLVMTCPLWWACAFCIAIVFIVITIIINLLDKSTYPIYWNGQISTHQNLRSSENVNYYSNIQIRSTLWFSIWFTLLVILAKAAVTMGTTLLASLETLAVFLQATTFNAVAACLRTL